MRQEVLQQLYNIMNIPENYGSMRHFIERFRPRLIEIATRDSESGVRTIAVELMDLLRGAGMLEPDDIDDIGKLVFDAEPKVRAAVVEFFAANIKDLYDAKIEELGGLEGLDDVLAIEDEEQYDTPRVGWIRLKCIAESLGGYDSQDQEEMPSQIDSIDFANVSGLESRFTLAAQTLYEKLPDLKDWEMLAGYLLFDHTSAAARSATERALRSCFKPDEKEELILLEVLNAVVKMNLTKIDEEHKGKKKHARAEIQEAQESAARKLAAIIPKLLKKYGADPKTVTVVLRLEHVLNLGVFQELRQDSTVYSKLLDEISAQFNGHADRAVLSAAGAALLHARGYEELEEVTENKVQSLWEDTINTLQKINKAGEISVRGSSSTKVLTELSNSLARLERLASISSPIEILEADLGSGETPPITILLDIIARGVYEDSNDELIDALEDESVLSAIRSMVFYFMWKVKGLSSRISDGDQIEDLEIDHLREWQETFTTNVTAAFSSRSTLDPVRLIGAGTILDLHVLFATLRPVKPSSKGKEKEVEANNGYVQTLVKEIVPEVQLELTQVFEALEKSFAKKGKKKLAEPDDDEAPEEEEQPEEEEDEDVTYNERQAEVLRAEQQLCELSGKLVLGILAQVIDTSGPLKGKLRTRLQRNRQRLGANFKEVVAYLEEKKEKGKRSHKANQVADGNKKKAEKSKERVDEADEEEEEEDDPFAEVEPEEDTMLDEELEEAARSPEEVRKREEVDGEGDEDEIMGD